MNFQPIFSHINVSKTSRYANSQIGYYGEQKELVFETYKRPVNKPDSSAVNYEITKSQEFRPDLVSVNFYGIPDFWWRIMEVNRMKDIMEFRAGRNIIIPGGSIMF